MFYTVIFSNKIYHLLKFSSFSLKKMNFNENQLHLLCDKEYFVKGDLTIFKNIVKNENNLLFQKNIDGNLPLHFLCFRGMYISSVHTRVFTKELNEAINFILKDYPLLFFEKNNVGETPLHILAYNYFNEHTCVIFKKIFDKLLRIQYVQEQQKTKQQHNKQQQNTKQQTMKQRNMIVQQIKNIEGNTPLYILCSLVHINTFAKNTILHMIRENPSLLKIKNKIGNTPLHKLAQLFHVSKEIDKNVHDIIKKMIEITDLENISCQNKNGQTSLHILIQNRNFNDYTLQNVVHFFKKDVSLKFLKDGNGDTPLHCMCMNPKFWGSILDFYENINLPTNMKNKKGDTPLHILCYKPYDISMDPILTFLLQFKNIKNNEKLVAAEIMMRNDNYQYFAFVGL
jgi:ankyrin repeat protein